MTDPATLRAVADALEKLPVHTPLSDRIYRLLADLPTGQRVMVKLAEDHGNQAMLYAVVLDLRLDALRIEQEARQKPRHAWCEDCRGYVEAPEQKGRCTCTDREIAALVRQHWSSHE